MRTRTLCAAAVALAIGLATALSPFASAAPDGLERVAADKGFEERGRPGSGPIPDYAFPGVADPRLATGLAGLAGTIAVLTIGFGTAAAVRRRTSERPPTRERRVGQPETDVVDARRRVDERWPA
jgi:PDGLE domain